MTSKPRKAAPRTVAPATPPAAPASPPPAGSGVTEPAVELQGEHGPEVDMSANADVVAPQPKYCAVPNCGKSPDRSRGHGMCAGHFASMRGYGTKEEGR